MSVQSTIQTALIAFLVATLVLPAADAWSNGGYSADPGNPDYGTHDWIADMALAGQTRDVSFLKSTHHTKYLLGTEAPDNPVYIGDSSHHHVYYYETGSIQDDVGAVRADAMYQSALGALQTDDFDNAAYYAGAMAHYISDLGVFGHTMGSATDWGSENHHSDYEGEVESRIGSISSPAGSSPGDESARNAALSLAEMTTFGSGAIMPNIWMDANYDWTDGVFVSSSTASLYASITKVASAINHLMIEAGYSSSPAPPQAPGQPASIDVFVNGLQTLVTWTPPASNGGAEITQYKIYRGTNSTSLENVATVTGDVFSWEDENVDRGKTYYYGVGAMNSAGTGGMSGIASITIPRKPTSWTLPIAISAISAALASTGALLWRRKAINRRVT